MLNNKEIAESLEEISVLLELKGENTFKVRAYQNASRIVRGIDIEMGEFVEQAQAGEIKGIGAALTEKITTLFETGNLPYLEELRASFPASLLDLLKISGLGAKKVKVLHEELGISSLGELEYACLENRLVELRGFGKKTQDNILQGIKRLAKYAGRFRISTAMNAAAFVIDELAQSGLAEKTSPAGSIRRHSETVKDIDLLATSQKPQQLMDHFVHLEQVDSVIAHGETKSSVVLKSGIAVDLRVVSDEQYPSALLHFTGSKKHNTILRGRAKKKDQKLNEYGLFQNDQPLALQDESAIYQALDLHYIPPEIREGLDEIGFAATAAFPELVTASDIKGVVHVHTNYSDGSVPLNKMAKHVKEMGYDYLGISDHSQTAVYAGGLKPDDIKRQHEEIDLLNEQMAPFRIFKGIESDILIDGSLDYPEEILSKFDFVIASVHSQFRLSKEQMTERLIKAINNPFTRILGHPTGRLILSREGYPLDMTAVLEAAAEAGIAIEINANPHRLDLDWRYHRRAKELGIPLAICPDAHSLEGIEDIRYGVGVARKGWQTKEDILTCWPVRQVADFFARRKT